MPSLDNVSHLLTICAEAPEAFSWVVWQDRTGLTVMPFGPSSSSAIVGLEQHDFEKAVVFFKRWKQESGSQKRLTFMRGRTDAFQDGRVLIKKWAGDRWAEWGISEVVGQVLDNYGFKMFEFTKALKRDQWPNASDIGIREVGPNLALSMFGPDAVLVVGRITVVHGALVPVVQGLLTSAWDSKGRAWRRARAGTIKTEEKLAKDVAVFENPKAQPTPSEVARIIQRIKRMITKTELFGDTAMESLVTSWKTRLQQMHNVAAKVDEGKHDRIPAGLLKALKALADSPTVHIVLCELDLAIDNFPTRDLDAFGDAADCDFDFSDWLTGVEDLQNKTPAQLWAGLGLKKQQAVPGLNTVEDPSGMADPWKPEAWAAFIGSGKALEFGPRWHQVVAITKMCELVIKGEPLLLMDQVGVGKTLQTVGTVVMYPHLRNYYIKNKRFPPAFKDLKCNTSDGNLPDRPHLIIVPVALFDQWEAEFKRYVKYGAMDLYPYKQQWQKASRQTIWENVFTLKDKQTLSHKVLLVAYTAAESDCSQRFTDTKKVAPNRPDRDPTLPIKTMLYDFKFGISTIDEAAKMRNPSHHWTTMNEISRISHCTIAATATPITNSPMDLVYIGRAIGIEGCEDDALMDDMRKNLLRASRKANIEFRNAREEGDLVQRILNNSIDLPAKNEQVKQMTSYTLALRKIFQGHTIRRALDAVDWEGNPISGLQPYVSQQLMLTPSQEESDALEVTASQIVKEHDTARTASMVAQAEGHDGHFKTQHRLEVSVLDGYVGTRNG